MNEYKNLASQTLVYGLGTIVPRLLNYLLLTPFYTRIFLKNEYGVVVELYVYIAFLLVLLTYGMETTYFRFTSSSSNKKLVYNNTLGSLFITTSLFVLLAILFKSDIAALIGYANNVQYIVWFSLIVAADAITAVPFAKLRNENRAFKFAFIKVGNILINIGLNVFFFIICKNSENLFFSELYNPNIGIGYVLICNLVASLFNIIALYSEFLSFRFKFNYQLFRKMVNYAWPLVIVGLAGVFNESIDKILVKYLSVESLDSMAQVGLYGANYKLAILMTIFIQMFKYAAEPFFFKKSGDADAKTIYANVMNYFIIFCFGIFLLVTLYIDVFKYFIDDKFWSGLGIVPIILLANMFLGIYYNLSVWYKLNNLTMYGAIIALVGMVITLVLNVILIPKVGFLGSAWAHLICYFTMVVVSFLWGRKVFLVKYSLKKACIYTLATLFIYFVFNFVSSSNFILNLLLATLGMLLFILLIFKVEKLTYNSIKALIKS